MNTKPLSILRSIAEHYAADARDFIERFDLLWEAHMHKTGRIKSFVDLLMACECALKSHIALGRENDDPTEVYKIIRKNGHRIKALAENASLLEDRAIYDELARSLDPFFVFVRYSLEAYDTFFPWSKTREEADINYSYTIGNNQWVLEMRRLIQVLIEPLNDELGSLVTDDLALIIAHQNAFEAFMSTHHK